MKRLTVTCLLAALAAGADDARAGWTFLPAGSDEALWLVRRDDANGLFGVAVRQADGKWQWAHRSISGRPEAVVADGKRLHVFFGSPAGHVVFRLGGREIATAPGPAHRLWPADAAPVALCAVASDTPRAPGPLLALVPRAAEAATGPGASRPVPPAGAPAIASRPAGPTARRLGLFRREGVAWEHLADLDAPAEALPGPGRPGPLLAATDRSVYVLLTGAHSAPRRLIRLEGAAWRDVPLELPSGVDRAVAMLVVKGRLLLVLAAGGPLPGRRSLLLAGWNERTGSFAFRPVLHDGMAFTWPADALPWVLRFGDQLALLWREDGAVRYGTCLPGTGELSLGADVEAFRRPPADGAGENIIQTFLWVVLLGVFVPMILFRSRRGYQPFDLPEGYRPGNLLVRVLAAVLDFLPISFLVSLVYRLLPGTMSDEEILRLWERIGRQEAVDLPVELAVTSVAMLTAFVVYGTLTEALLGTTLGKRLLKLRVVAHGGERPDLRQCLLRNLLKIVELISLRSYLFFLVPLVPIVTRYRQRFGDLLARTAVVDARFAPPAPQPTSPEEPTGPEGEPASRREDD